MRHVPPEEATEASTKLEYAIVLVRIDENSRLHIKQTNDVRVVFVDERTADEAAVFMPKVDQFEEIKALLANRYPVTRNNDHAEIAVQTLARLARQAVIVAGMKEPDR